MISEFILPTDPRWTHFLQGCRHDFYHLPDYVALCANQEGARPVAFYAQDGSSAFLAPLLIRPLPASLGAPKEWTDCVSPYGYSTPLVSPSDESLKDFLELFCQAARRLGVVTVLFRLHPLLPLHHDVLGKFGELKRHGQTVYVDLTKPREELWRQTRADHRSDIRKLERLGFTARLDDWSFFEEFMTLYHATMQRLGARQDYLFSREYFAELRATLNGHFHLCCVLSKEGDLASAGTYVDWGGIVQGHLAGNHQQYLRFATSKLMQHHVREWAQEHSYTIFHLGGGVGGARDSLFEFKSGFSKERADFFTYQMILDEHKHETLIHLVRSQAGDSSAAVCSDYFPAYRRPLSSS